jgi:cell division septal protein FtsQ
VGVLAALAIAYVIAHSSLLGVDSVEVPGVDAATARTVRAAARIPDGDPLLFLDQGAVARRVERIPSVARAEVSTELPSTVVIRVTPRLPVAWADARVTTTPVAILDRDGRVIALAATAPAGLPRVVGVGEPGAAGSHVANRVALAALASLPAALRLQVARFEIRPQDGPVLVLGGAAPTVDEIRLGSLARLPAKATAALAVMESLGARSARAHVLGVQVPDAPYTAGSP